MEKPAQPRICLMDELRGFAVFCMVFYHGFYTLAFLHSSAFGMYWLRFFSPAEPWFAGLFILIAGISSQLSHSNLARGLKLLGVSLVVTAVTVVLSIFLPGNEIWFGILQFLSVCMIFFGLLQRYYTKRNQPPRRFKAWQLVVCGVLFALTWGVAQGYLGVGALSVALPQAGNDIFAVFGWHTNAFLSADYFPLLPWAFMFAAGTVLGRLAAAGRFPKWMYPSRVPLLQFFGRHALVIYVAHQPIIYGLALLLQPNSRV